MEVYSNSDSNITAESSLGMASPQQSGAIGNGSTTNTMPTLNNNNNTISTSATKPATNDNLPLTSKPRLLELVREVDSTLQLDEDVEDVLMQMVDDFVDDAIKHTSALALHRKSSKVEAKDIQLHLERKYNMWLPGFGTDELRPYKRSAVTEAHKQRMALIRKTIKKY